MICVWLKLIGGTSLVVQWLRLCSQCQGPAFDPWSGNQISQAATRISHTVSKNPKFYSKDPVCFK